MIFLFAVLLISRVFCVAAHKLTLFSWMFYFFRSLMTIIELNNCPLVSLSLVLDLISFSFPIYPHTPDQIPTHSTKHTDTLARTHVPQ